jgi:uncharacterized protein YtpQ (UPF0354 family)
MFKRIAVVLTALLLLAGPARAEVLSPQAFTEAFAKALAKALPDAKITVTGDLQTETRGTAGGAVTLDLHNAYARYLEHPQDVEAVIENCVSGQVEILQLAKNKEQLDRSRILPVFKPPRWLDALRQRRAPEPLIEPYNAELIVAYVEDQPTSMRFLTTLDDVGDRAKLRDLALANLDRVLPKIEMRAGDDGIFLIEAGGDYEASQLLLDDIWTGGQIKVDGDIVVAVPAKDALLVTGSHNQAGLKKMRAIAADLVAGPYGLTRALFVYHGGKFVKFDN